MSFLSKEEAFQNQVVQLVEIGEMSWKGNVKVTRSFDPIELSSVTLKVPNIFRKEGDPPIQETRLETLRIPGASEYYGLVQLLNPGWDSRIRVFNFPTKRSGRWSLDLPNTPWILDPSGGGRPTAYIVIKDGGEPMIADKQRYKKTHFEALYGDCGAFTQSKWNVPKRKKFKYIAKHVHAYDELCQPGD